MCSNLTHRLTLVLPLTASIFIFLFLYLNYLPPLPTSSMNNLLMSLFTEFHCASNLISMVVFELRYLLILSMYSTYTTIAYRYYTCYSCRVPRYLFYLYGLWKVRYKCDIFLALFPPNLYTFLCPVQIHGFSHKVGKLCIFTEEVIFILFLINDNRWITILQNRLSGRNFGLLLVLSFFMIENLRYQCFINFSDDKILKNYNKVFEYF